MDTTRAKNALPTKNATHLPNLAQIADEGALFDNAVTTAPWTLPSHASMFSGQYTSDHGTHAGTQYFDPSVPPLTRRLKESGYQTVAVSNNTWVTPEFGFGDGFDEFYTRSRPFPAGEDPAFVRDRLRKTPFQTGVELVSQQGTASTVGNLLYEQFFRERGDDGARLTNWRIKRWLSNTRDPNRPFFLFANYIEPHLSYSPPAEYLPDEFDDERCKETPQDPWGYLTGTTKMTDSDFEALETLYEAELSYLDAKLGELYDLLQDRDILDETVIVIVGDHGENIGEHALMDHQFCLYDTLLRVPLIIRHPHETTSENLSSLVELRDLYPTILEIAGADRLTSPTVSQRDLLSSISGHTESDSHREYTISEYHTPRPSIATLRDQYPNSSVDISQYDRSLRCIRTDAWKYIQATDGREELFDLENDPEETENVVEENASVKEQLRRRLVSERGELKSLDGGRYEPNAETEERLNSLGYI